MIKQYIDDKAALDAEHNKIISYNESTTKPELLTIANPVQEVE